MDFVHQFNAPWAKVPSLEQTLAIDEGGFSPLTGDLNPSSAGSTLSVFPVRVFQSVSQTWGFLRINGCRFGFAVP